ncbi:MAG: aldo/keto reductase [Gemmatimonadaceae bacterium]|nr:aldo/keto reductase [Gemmatimonadaceae bacterium]
MRHRNLGKDGPRIPVIGLGAWPIGGGMGGVDEAEAIRTVRGAIDAGVTLVDTAQAYGPSESIVGKALRDGYRERCFLATKVSGDYSPAAVRAAMDDSLRALGVDHVDLYQVHSWRGERDPIEETMAAMARLQEEGKTRHLGVSNFDAAQMEAARAAAPFVSSQPRYSMLHREIEAADLPWCEANGVGNLAHSPLAKGLLTGRYAPGHVFPGDDERSKSPRFQGEIFARSCAVAARLGEVAADKGITLVQMAIAWCLRQPAVSCVLVGAKSLAQVREHVGAAQVTFDAGELDRIDAILREAP